MQTITLVEYTFFIKKLKSEIVGFVKLYFIKKKERFHHLLKKGLSILNR
jgi:hypothetical protein